MSIEGWGPSRPIESPHKPMMSKRTGDSFAAFVIITAIVAGCIAAIH